MPPPRKTIIVTQKLPHAVEDRLIRTYDARLNPGPALTQDQILALAQGMTGTAGPQDARKADGLLVTVTDRIDASVIAALPDSVKIIANFGVGYDNIDIAAADKRGIVVTNTPDVLTEATADLTLLLLLGAARRAAEGCRVVREGRWRGWTPTFLLGQDVSGQRLGIVGMGRIGRAVARRARAFGMEIHYHNRRRLAPDLEDGAVYHAELDDMLPLCMFLSLHAAATPETRNLLNAETLARLPRGAIVVNTARGDLVDDEALIEALKSGHVAAAGLDVYKGEPDIHPAYRKLDTVFALPHLGSATRGTRVAMGMRAIDNLDAFFAGRPVRDRVGAARAELA